MRYVLTAIFAASMLAPAQAAFAEPGKVGDQDVAQEVAPKSGEARRCVKSTQMGSRIKKRLCFTESEWARIEENSKSLAEKLQDGGNGALDGASLEGYRRPE